MSLSLKKHGFKFVGSTIVYAHMQATGMVNDHLVSCFRYKEVKVRTNKSRIPIWELIYPCWQGVVSALDSRLARTCFFEFFVSEIRATLLALLALKHALHRTQYLSQYHTDPPQERLPPKPQQSGHVLGCEVFSILP